jgi:hypothetical protein
MDSKKNHIVKCKPEADYHVWIQFEDGLDGIVDLRDLLGKKVFKESWRSIENFNAVRIDPVTHTLTWGKEGDEVDVDPASLRKEILDKL